MKSAREICDGYAIRLPRYDEGNRKVTCPHCGPTRRHKRDKSLSVTVDAKGVQFKCHNCDWKGGEYFEQRTVDGGRKVVSKPRPRTGNPDALRRLHNEARRHG